MWLTALRGILAHRLRLAATATAVLLGVALMSGTLVFTDTVTRTFDDLFGDVYAGTDVVVRGQAAFDAPQNMGAQRDRVDASLVSTVAAVPGVAAAEGGVLGYARLVDKSGDAMGNPANGAPTIGYGWPENAELNPFHLVAGTAPAAPDQVVIDAKSARDAGFVVGDTVTVLTHGPAQRFHIVGIVKFGTADSPGGATVAGFALPTAQNLIAQPGKYDDITVVSDGTSPEVLAQRIAAVLPARVEAVTGETATAETTDQMHKALGFFSTFMLVFAGVSLLVGGFMIFNTFAITVAQRTREHGLLRALGARRRQLLGAVLAEALVVGLVAAAAGTALGVVVASGLQSLMNALGMEIPASSLVFRPRTVVLSMLVGVGVTVVAALLPARRASRVAPMSALRAVEASAGNVSLSRLLSGLVLAGGGVGALLLGLYQDVSHRVTVVGAGVLGLFIGITVLGPTFARPFSGVLGWPVVRLRGVAGAIARENAMRNPRRTAATAAALMIGVGLVGFITVFVSSAKTSVDHVVRDAFSGDLVIDSGASQGGGGGIDPAVAQEIRALPEVAAVTGIRLGFAQVDGSATGLPAIDPSDGFRILDVGVLAGNPADLGPDAIAVQEDEARSHGWSVGDSVPVRFTTGDATLRVAMIYRETNPLGKYVLGTPAFAAHFADQADWEVLVQKAPGVSSEALRAAVTSVTAATPGIDVLTSDEYVDRVTAPMDQLLALVYALLSLAILIALLGIANTLALSIHERVHEIGLLRAVGMTRRQLRTAIHWESAIVALQGTLLGLGVGIFLSWALVQALSDQGINSFDVPWSSMGIIAGAAIIAGVVAGLGPARRAARLDVLRAVAAR